MSLFKYFSFVGAAALLFTIGPGNDGLFYAARVVGSVCLMWGCFYFLLRENEMLYGSVALIMAVLIQPFYDFPVSTGVWMIIDIIGVVFLLLAGFICKNIEKARAVAHAKIEAEMEMYRKHEERFRSQEIEEDKKHR